MTHEELVIKSCNNCKHKDKKLTEEPCFKCSAYRSEWEETENGKRRN